MSNQEKLNQVNSKSVYMIDHYEYNRVNNFWYAYDALGG